MEKWKIVAIVALLAALPALSYIQSKPSSVPTPDGSPTQATPSPEAGGKPASPPPPYLQNWWGKKPPTFSFPKELWTNTDKPIQLEELKGKVVLLELWRAECTHCQEAAPVLEHLAEEHGTKGFEIVGVHCSGEGNNIEHDWEAIKTKWMPEHGVTYPVAFDEKRTVFTKFHAEKYPTLFLIDRQGIIRYAHEGMTPALEKELKAALKQVLEGKNPVWPPSKSEVAEDAAAKFAPEKN